MDAVLICQEIQMHSDIDWMQFFWVFLGAFLGFGFSLVLYYKQIKKDKEKEKNDREQNFKNLLVYYRQLIESVKKASYKQLDFIDSFIQKQEEDHIDLQGLAIVATNDFGRLANIDNRGVFEAWTHFFVESDSIKTYKNTNASLDFLEGTFKEMIRIHYDHTKDMYSQLMAIKDILDNLPDQLSTIAMNMANELGETRWQNELYVYIDSTIQKYHTLLEDGADIHKINKEFLVPLLEAFVSKYKTASFAPIILNSCKKIRVKLHHIENEVKNIIVQFKLVRERTKESLAILEATETKLLVDKGKDTLGARA